MIALRLVLVLCSSGCVASLHAASFAGKSVGNEPVPAEAPASSMRRGGGILIAALDINRDGVLSAAEVAQAPVLLRALDLDLDGNLSGAELKNEAMPRSSRRTAAVTVQFARVRHGGSGSNLAFTLDANHDGEIQAMEIANAASSLKDLDTDADGQVSFREMNPSPTMLAAKI
jgi:hypothetical protein